MLIFEVYGTTFVSKFHMRWMSNDTIELQLHILHPAKRPKICTNAMTFDFGLCVCVCVSMLCVKWIQCQHDYHRVVHCNLLVVAKTATMHLIGLINTCIYIHCIPRPPSLPVPPLISLLRTLTNNEYTYIETMYTDIWNHIAILFYTKSNADQHIYIFLWDVNKHSIIFVYAAYIICTCLYIIWVQTDAFI